MKKLKKILLINWLYFSKQLIEVEDINFLTGKNGAGKSTVIDALQIVLLGETNARNFNQAANEKSQRTLDRYLRADMDSNSPYSRRGKDFSSYIACEFLNEEDGSRFVTGIVFDCRSDGSCQDRFFIYDSGIPENCFLDRQEAMDIPSLRIYLKQQYGVHQKLYDSHKEYRTDMLAKWNVHSEQVSRMLKKAVSFRPIVDIQKFITENICDIPDKPDIEATGTFRKLWPSVTVGRYMESIKQPNAHVVCGSVQSVALHLDSFKDTAFDYLIVDEAHHAAADTYQKVLSYFKPAFTLGLTATPERTDDNKVILDIFKNTAHKLDIQTAVEIGELVPVRCIRIHTNIDLSKVRFNSVQYNIRDLESKIYVPERNRLIVDTWLQYVRNKRTVVFCASVKHAEQIAALFREAGIQAASVSGGMKQSERKEFQDKFVSREIQVLCACDLLNEGWDCPEIEVLFMARPTMSKVLYTQQLGRGMRLYEGKESLMVFDFVDNASQYNMPQSLHRLFKLKEYKPGQLAVAPGAQKTAEAELYAKGEKPEALIDWPVDATDYELVDIFNWQEEAEGMISQMEFVRRVDVQTETIERYVREGKLVPDLVVPMSEHRTFKYFREETLEKYARQYGWILIDDSNRKDMFMDMIRQMDMSYSYKPVLIKAVLLYADERGRINLEDIVSYFKSYYEGRRSTGLPVEKKNSIFAKGGYTDKEAERNILANPFKRFEDMQMLRHTRTLGIVQVDESVWKKLSQEEKVEIEKICDEKLESYYKRLK